MSDRGRNTAFAAYPFSPVDRGQIDRWIEDAQRTPPQLFNRYRFNRCELVKMVGGERGALVVEHVCEVFQLWSDGREARMRRLRFAVDPRGPISAEGEFSLIEPSAKPGKRTNPVVVALVDFLVPVLLAFGVPWGATTSAKMTRTLDLVAVGLFRLPSTKSELQRRMRDHRARLALDRAERRRLAQRLAQRLAHKASFVGPPKPVEMVKAEFSEGWRSLLPSQRERIREAVRRGLSTLKIQPPNTYPP